MEYLSDVELAGYVCDLFGQFHVLVALTVYFSDLDLARRFAVARVTIWRWSSQGILPKPVKVGPNCSRWVGEEIEAAEARWLVEREKRFGKAPSENDWVGETPFDEPPAPVVLERNRSRNPAPSPRRAGMSRRRAPGKNRSRSRGVVPEEKVPGPGSGPGTAHHARDRRRKDDRPILHPRGRCERRRPGRGHPFRSSRVLGPPVKGQAAS